MSTSLEPVSSPPGPAPAHWVVALLAIAGAALVQTSWTTTLRGLGTENWWPYSAAVILAATAWLLATAWMHWRLARGQGLRRATPRQQMDEGLCDLVLAIFAGVLLVKGHTSRLALSGLWVVPPTLLAVGISSAALMLYASLAVRSQPSLAAKARVPASWRDYWRTAIGLALIALLFLQERQPLPDRSKVERPKSKLNRRYRLWTFDL